MTDQPASLAEALARLQAELPYVGKDKTAKVKVQKDGRAIEYSYDYANLASILVAIKPLMGPLGLAFTAKPTTVFRDNGDREFVLVYKLLHGPSGESDAGEWPLPDPLRTTPQQVGSAITYARRYSLCAVTGVAPDDDDDDGQAASQAAPANSRQRGRPPVRAAGALPRNQDGSVSRGKVTDDELAATGNMTDAAQREHNKLERQVLGVNSKGQTVTGGVAEHLPATPEDDPWLDAPAQPLPAPKAAGDPAQAIAMHFTRLGITDRDVRLGMIGALVGRPLRSSKEMTAYEGLALKRRLEKIRDEDAFKDFFEHEADAFRADISEHRKEPANA